MPDNPSTELALIKVLSDQLADFRALASRVDHFGERLWHLEHKSQHRHQEIMTALETLAKAVADNAAAQADLTTAVNAAVARLGSPGATDAQLLTIAGQIDANTATTKTQTEAINTALTPPTATT